MMTDKQMKELLEKYYAGNTTSDEEAFLRSYFLQEEVVEEFLTDKDFFTQLEELNREIPDISEDFENRLAEAIGRSAKDEEMLRHCQWKVKRKVFISMAASLLLLVGIGLYFQEQDSEPVQIDTFTDPQQAALETQRVLQLFATAVKQGKRGLCIATQTAAEVQKQLNDIKIYWK